MSDPVEFDEQRLRREVEAQEQLEAEGRAREAADREPFAEAPAMLPPDGDPAWRIALLTYRQTRSTEEARKAHEEAQAQLAQVGALAFKSVNSLLASRLGMVGGPGFEPGTSSL